MKIRVGTRGSRLALAQTRWVVGEMKKKNPSLAAEIITIKTTGDRDLHSSLKSMGGKGVFVKEIEEALVARQIDFAVHSLKDVPQLLPQGLILGPTPEREDPRDAFISRFGEWLHELPKRSVLGTSSPRREAFVRYRYRERNYSFEPLRGNVETRLRKVKDGNYDATLLASAGLKRLGLADEITHVIEVTDILPAPCQGCLGLELREEDSSTFQLLESIQHTPTTRVAEAERSFLQGLGGNCRVPLGGLATFEGETLMMKGMLLDPRGEKAVASTESGPSDNPSLVGSTLAERLLYDGGSAILLEADGDVKEKSR